MHKNGGEHLAHYTQLLKYFNGKLVLPLFPHIILAASSIYPTTKNAKPEVHPTDFWPSLGRSSIFHLEIKILLRKGASHCWGHGIISDIGFYFSCRVSENPRATTRFCNSRIKNKISAHIGKLNSHFNWYNGNETLSKSIHIHTNPWTTIRY